MIFNICFDGSLKYLYYTSSQWVFDEWNSYVFEWDVFMLSFMKNRSNQIEETSIFILAI
jgi:hypothetical protein